MTHLIAIINTAEIYNIHGLFIDSPAMCFYFYHCIFIQNQSSQMMVKFIGQLSVHVHVHTKTHIYTPIIHLQIHDQCKSNYHLFWNIFCGK